MLTQELDQVMGARSHCESGKIAGCLSIVDERVGKTGDYYYCCTDMRVVKTGKLLDLDFDIEDQE